MSDIAYTPGPWAVCPRNKWRIHDHANNTVAATGGDSCLVGQHEANARLIAAAPDALEFALFYDAYMIEQFPQGLQPNYDNGTLHPRAAEAWGRCKSFIAKADGR